MNIEQHSTAEFEKQIQGIWASIDRVGLKQDEIKNYIVIIDQGLEILNVQLRTATQLDVKMKILISIQKNTELIAKLYEVISSFESIRQRYQQDISKLTNEKLRFAYIELRRLEDKIGDVEINTSTLINELRSLIQQASSSKELVEKAKPDIKKHPEYSMN